MKKIVFIFFSFFFLLFFNNSATFADTLTFGEANTLKEYEQIRGKTKLEYVLFALQTLAFGNEFSDWDEMENFGELNLKSYQLKKSQSLFSLRLINER